MTLETKQRAEPLDQDTIFELLSNSRRRFVLHYLRHADPPVDLGTLADELAAWENDVGIDELSNQQRKRVYVSLYQTHLEKLNETSVIDYESDEGVIELTYRASELFTFMDRGDDALFDEHREVVENDVDGGVDESKGTSTTGQTRGLRWPAYYIGLAIVSTFIYLMSWADVGTFASVPEAAVGLAISVVFMLSGIVHFLTERWGHLTGDRRDPT